MRRLDESYSYAAGGESGWTEGLDAEELTEVLRSTLHESYADASDEEMEDAFANVLGSMSTAEAFNFASASAQKNGAPSKPKPPCAVLTACPECSCGQSWVLLGSVSLAKDKGIIDDPDMTERRWVKPTEVLCANTDWISGVGDRIAKLEAKVDGLSKPPAEQAPKPPAGQTPPAT